MCWCTGAGNIGCRVAGLTVTGGGTRLFGFTDGGGGAFLLVDFVATPGDCEAGDGDGETFVAPGARFTGCRPASTADKLCTFGSPGVACGGVTGCLTAMSGGGGVSLRLVLLLLVPVPASSSISIFIS